MGTILGSADLDAQCPDLMLSLIFFAQIFLSYKYFFPANI